MLCFFTKDKRETDDENEAENGLLERGKVLGDDAGCERIIFKPRIRLRRRRARKAGLYYQMAYKLFEEVVLTKNIPEKRLKRGDVAIIVEHHLVSDGEDGYSLEIFNALGDTISVITIAESAIAPIKKDEIFSVRSLEAA